MKLTENLVLGKSRGTDIENVRKLNCWGSDLTDVSILRKMINVQVVSLSVNKITGLEDFSNCTNLEELYIRKNEIKELSEIRHLKKLSKLTKLWLADNPCAEADKYRLTVLKHLPNLQKLDNINVTEDEINQAVDEGIDLSESPDISKPITESNINDVKNESNGTRVNDSPDDLNACGDGQESQDLVGNPLEPIEVSRSRQNPVMISWDETNKIRQQLGLKPLPVEKVTQLKPRTTHSAKSRNSNILQAALHLVKELDADSLEIVADAVRNRLENLY